ncbi:endonuclease MutS2 [bacterium]|nr:endonuclease MutS2 [bacterium]
MGQLEEQSVLSLEFNKVKNILSNFARLHQSQQLCFDLNVESDIDKIKKNLLYTKEAKAILDNALDIPVEFVAPISDFSADKLNSYLKEVELMEAAKSLKTARLIKNFIKEHADNTALKSLSDAIVADKELEDEIFSKIDIDNNVVPSASQTLEKLNETLKTYETEIKAKISELLSNSQFTVHLQEQIYTLRDNRVVFPVMANSKRKVAGITHDYSATSKTAYIEPSSLIPLNNKIRECKSKINEEIIRILKDLTKKVKSNFKALENNEKLLAEIDFHFAKARYAVKVKAVEPVLSDVPMIKLTEMIHPLLIGNVKETVANDFEIGNGYNTLIITGSNTGGKTVTLKTVGLLTLMVKAGLFVTCADAVIYPFERVLADIGDSQNIMQSLSTFSGHLKKIIEMLETSNEKTLCLIDEICAGTDPQEGAILAETILTAMNEKRVTTIVTTHFGELKTLEYEKDLFKNACVEFDKETLKPTYKLIIGCPGISNTLLIAENLGVDKEIIKQSKDILDTRRSRSVVIIEKLAETQQRLDRNLREVETIKKDSAILKEEYEIKVSELNRNKKRAIKDVERKFYTELATVKNELRTILDDVKHNRDESSIRRSYTKISQIENGFKSQVSAADVNESYDMLDFSKIKVGDTVMIKDINQPVIITSLPDKNDNVEVLMGEIKTKVKGSRLARLDKTLAKKPKLRMQVINSFEHNYKGISNTLDLRGYRVQDALELLENFLDKASLNNISPIYVIHGHGSGALKVSVRDYISTSPYVSKYRPGESVEGGDGVSVVDLI